MENKKIGVRVVITQETDFTSHYLYDIFNVKEFNKDFPNAEHERIQNIKEKAIKLIKDF